MKTNIFNNVVLKVTFLTAMLFISNQALALEASSTTTLTFINSYNQSGGGDVIFRIANPTATCYGFWINKTDAGFSANFAMLLAAYQSNSNLSVSGFADAANKWTGSAAHYCKLHEIQFQKP